MSQFFIKILIEADDRREAEQTAEGIADAAEAVIIEVVEVPNR